MRYYAVFNPNTYVVLAIDETEYEMRGNDRVEIPAPDDSLIGKIYDPDSGTFIEKEIPPHIEVTVTISGGDGMDPPGIDVNDPDGLRVAFELRMDGEIVPVNGVWRIPIRDVSSGKIDDVVKVAITDGVGEVVYKPLSVGVFTIDNSDFEAITGPGGVAVVPRLSHNVIIKVYR